MPRAFKWQHVAVGLFGLVTLLLAAPAPARQAWQPLHDVAALKAQVAAFAGSGGRIDPRLVVPRCPAPALSWARSDAVRVDCLDPAWTLYVPIDQPVAAAIVPVVRPIPVVRAASRPAVRRGDRVMVEAGGDGFAVSIEAEAERDADGTRVALKSPAGRHFLGRIEDGGRIVLAR